MTTTPSPTNDNTTPAADSIPGRIRAAWQPGMSVSDIANAIGATKGVVSGHYTRNSVLRRSCPLAYPRKRATNATRPAEFDAAVAAYIPAMQKRAWLFRKTSDAADDLVQDTLEESLRRWSEYDSRKSFYGWLCLMMRHAVFLASRKGKIAVIDSEDSIVHQSTPPAQEWATDLRAAVATISGLPDGVELLEHAAGATMAEIGERTGISRQRVEQKIKRARAGLARDGKRVGRAAAQC